jgi:hypothetical protein
MKEWDSMTRHRGLFLALGFCALIGLSARESRAAGITMTLTWSGGSLTFNSLSPSPYVGTGSSATSLVVNTGAVDNFLTSHGSAITFTGLSATSNFPGGVPVATEATLSENGQAVLSGTSGATAITIATTESGFTAPGGTGTLTSLPSLSFNNVATGTFSSSSSYDSTSTTAYSSTSTGPTLNPGTPPSAPTTIGIGSIASGFTLGNTGTVDLTGSTPGQGTYSNFSVSATLAGEVVPEPASIIMMLTGMPLPLVVLGLLRRRRAAA